MGFDPRMLGAPSRRGRLRGLFRALIIAGFGIVQLILAARIALDLDVVALTGTPANFIIAASDAIAAPVQGVVKALGTTPFGAGSKLDPAIIGALAGWSLVEGLILSIAARFGL